MRTQTGLIKYLFLLCFLTSQSVFSATPLERAAATGDLDTVKSLISLGADVNEVDDDSIWTKTPLFAAAESGNHEIVVYLLSKGADTTLASAAGATPLRKAAHNGHDGIVRSLLENGANPEEDTDSYQRSPFVWAILGARDGNTANYVNVLEILREHGADCPSTFTHPVNDSTVSVADSAMESGPEISNTFAKLCGGGT